MLPTPDGDCAPSLGRFARQIRHAAPFLGTAGLASRDRGASLAPNAWMDRAGSRSSGRRRDGAGVRASTSEQAAYVVKHADAKVVFVDTPAPARARVRGVDDWAHVERVVLLDDALDARAVLARLADAGKKAPSYAEVERKLVTWSGALAIGAARDREQPGLVRGRR